MIETWLQEKFHQILLYIESITKQSYWFVKSVTCIIVISLFFAFPSFDILFKGVEFKENWDAIMAQVKDPFHPKQYAPESHQSKLTFRLTVPVLAYVLQLRLFGLLVVQVISVVALFLLYALLIFKITTDRVITLCLTFSLGFIFTGNVLVSDIRGIFDGVAFALISAIMYVNSPILVFLLTLLASFTDERALISSSLIFLWFILRKNQPLTNITIRQYFLFNARAIALVLAWIMYFLIRYFLTYYFNFKTINTGTAYLKEQINNFPMGIWSGLEGFWIIVIFSLIILFVTKNYWFLLPYLFSIFIIIGVALSVIDITRSMAYLLPAIFISLQILYNYENKLFIRHMSLIVALTCLFPTYYVGGKNTIQLLYPLPLQIIRIITS